MGTKRLTANLLRALLGTPLALDPESAHARVLHEIANHDGLTEEEIGALLASLDGGAHELGLYALDADGHPILVASGDDALAALRRPGQLRTTGTVAVIPIAGYINQRASIWDEYFGGTSVEATRDALRAAVGNVDVQAIVFDVDSPGGTVAGITELASEIRAARGQKPMVAIANTCAASAAYWLAAQADYVMASESAQVGSIGIYMVHQDISQALEAAGIRTTLVSAGQYKTEGTEYEPLSDEAKAYLQEKVDAFYDSFVGDVAKGRSITSAKVKADFGQGRMLLAKPAQAAGMIDAVGTMDEAIRRAAQRGIAGKTKAADEAPDPVAEQDLPFSDRLAFLRDEAAGLVAHAGKRAELRAKEHRPPFSADALASMRTIRDAFTSLIALADPAPVAGAEEPAKPAVQPPPVPALPQAAPVRRFRSDEEWLAHLTGGS